jgi:hypothetical protein
VSHEGGAGHEGHEHPEGHEQVSEEELRARLEEELRRITVQDVLLQTVVSLVNLGGQRLGATPDTEDMRDLDQVRMAIEGVRGLLPVLEERNAEQMRPVRDALAQLQMAYARLAGEAPQPAGTPGGGGPAGAGGGEGGASGQKPPESGPERGSGARRPREGGGLWVPPGSAT